MNQPASSVIHLERLTKRFGPVTAVDRVSLDFAENEFFALLGPSGCGKTTLLRMIAGFETPDEGRVLLDGKDITTLRPNRRPVNLMFQSYALFPHMTVRGNVAYGLEMEKLPRDEVRRRTEEVLETTQLGEFADRKPTQLSGGQKQRVALARALVKRPRVLLLDEPLGALDKKLRERMQLELKRLQNEVGITFVVVTHDQEEALVMADRIALMKDGVVVQCADPQTLYEHPDSRFVAEFIGVTNFFEGVTVSDGVRVDGLGVLEGTPPTGTESGAMATIAVRPERIGVSRDEPGNVTNRVRGAIEQIAYHGQDISLHVRLENGSIVIVRVTPGDASAAGIAVDETVWCAWAPRHSRILVK
ncbi:MAG: ABC transporter ATP-binding protein [Rhodospirillales bacterium]